MDKRAILAKIIERLRADLALYARAASTARAEATDEQSKAENKYDTRGLEASYLARGQSRQMAETETALAEFEAMQPRAFSGMEAIDIGALVEIEGSGGCDLYLIANRAGGTEIHQGGLEIVLITPQSPLGQQLVGRRKGETLDLTLGPTKSRYTIRRVS